MAKDVHLVFFILIIWFRIFHFFIAADFFLGILLRKILLSGASTAPEVQVLFIIQMCGGTRRLVSAIVAEVITHDR
jgi:hypothetical protein